MFLFLSYKNKHLNVILERCNSFKRKVLLTIIWARLPAGEKWNADDADNYDFKILKRNHF